MNNEKKEPQQKYDEFDLAADSRKSRPVTIKGEIFQIKAFTLIQNIQLGGALDRVLIAISSVLVDKAQLKISDMAMYSTEIARVLKPYAEDVISIFCMATGKPREWVEAIEDGPEGQELFTTIVDIRINFFVSGLQRRARTLLEKYENLQSEMQSGNSSSSLSIPGTSSETTQFPKSDSHSSTMSPV